MCMYYNIYRVDNCGDNVQTRRARKGELEREQDI